MGVMYRGLCTGGGGADRYALDPMIYNVPRVGLVRDKPEPNGYQVAARLGGLVAQGDSHYLESGHKLVPADPYRQ